MLIDYRDASTPADVEGADLCIIGAGAAGISIAHSFIGTAMRVCLVERGGLGGKRINQQLRGGHPSAARRSTRAPAGCGYSAAAAISGVVVAYRWTAEVWDSAAGFHIVAGPCRTPSLSRTMCMRARFVGSSPMIS